MQEKFYLDVNNFSDYQLVEPLTSLQLTRKKCCQIGFIFLHKMPLNASDGTVNVISRDLIEEGHVRFTTFVMSLKTDGMRTHFLRKNARNGF